LDLFRATFSNSTGKHAQAAAIMKTYWIAMLLALNSPLFAGEAFKPEELSDTELAQLRGRYVLPDRIISFGIVMTSTWKDSAGQVIGGQIGMNFTSGSSQPVLYTEAIDYAGNGNPVPQGSGQVRGGSGLDSVRGIVQSVRVAGDDNHGLNDLDVRITRGTAPDAAIPKADWNGPKVVSNSAGTVRMSNQAGGLAIAIQANNGQGTSSQHIAAGGVAQHSAIGGNQNSVQNLTALNVMLRDLPRSVDMRSSLEQLRLLCPIR
jgi:hypothetical protein